LAHRRRRNRPGIPADTADSGEEIRQPDGAIGGGERGNGRGGRGLLIGAEIDGHYCEQLPGNNSGELPFPEREERKRWR
jgi:hypothetical protein